jgi:hypothetical protein
MKNKTYKIVYIASAILIAGILFRVLAVSVILLIIIIAGITMNKRGKRKTQEGLREEFWKEQRKLDAIKQKRADEFREKQYKKSNNYSLNPSDSKQDTCARSWTSLDLLRGTPRKPPTFTPEMISPDSAPVSTRTEAKKIYRALLERYRIVDPMDVSNAVDMLSHDIGTATWGCQDDVNDERENIREIKMEIKEAKQQQKRMQQDEFYDQGSEDDEDLLMKELESLELQLHKAEMDLQSVIRERDSFKNDKREYIANHINCLAHGDDWAFTSGPVKYFIYRDFKGNVTARSITHMKSDVESVTGFCTTRNAERTFKRYRILEHASGHNDLLEKLAKYNGEGVTH